MASPKNKPQVILKIEEDGHIQFVKKWFSEKTGKFYLSIEGHTPDRALNHNANAPAYFFPIDEKYVMDLFKSQGKEYLPGKDMFHG